MRRLALIIGFLAATSAMSAERVVTPCQGCLAEAIAGAEPGDVLILEDGIHEGAVIIDRPLMIRGTRDAIVDGKGQGTVITIDAPDVTLSGFAVTGSGNQNQNLDSGVKILKQADRAVVQRLFLDRNMHGIDVHGGVDSRVIGNEIIGTEHPHMNARGNGIYIWNSPGTLIEGNSVRYGRDGIFSNTSKDSIYRGNIFRDLRFAVHFMYTARSEVSGNVSIGNHLGYAIMMSDRPVIRDNLSLGDRDYGLLFNYSNSGDISGNLIRGGPHKCLFIYNAHRNLIWNNRFEGCDIGIHFTAGSERNVLTGNAFIGNRNQVKYVGTRHIEWSHEGRGNFWSDNPGFDLNGDGISDSIYRPNDLMDHILWSQPAAGLLIGSPAVQLVRWSQQSFPATLPGGVVDSFPLMQPLTISVPAETEQLESEVAGRWAKEKNDAVDIEDFTAH